MTIIFIYFYFFTLCALIMMQMNNIPDYDGNQWLWNLNNIENQ